VASIVRVVEVLTVAVWKKNSRKSKKRKKKTNVIEVSLKRDDQQVLTRLF
jgi:hypothetical protein